MADVAIFGQVRGAIRLFFPTAQQEVQLMLTEGAEQLVVQCLPVSAATVQQGNSWQATFTTGITGAVALPTGTSLMSMNNFESTGGKSYVIESFGTYEGIVDATQTDVTMMGAMLNKKGSAQATGGTLFSTIQSLSGKGAYGGAAIFRSAATVVNDTWFPHQSLGSMAAAAAGSTFKVNEVPVAGLYIVPPGGTFSIVAVKAALPAGAQQFPYIRWHEVQLNLG